MVEHRLQTATNTGADRYPGIFSAAVVLSRQLLPSRRLRILSFGCSTGEELISLKRYFPDAELFGCDVDDAVLRTAAERVGGLAVVFRSSEAALSERGPFDLVFAMSVLCVYGKDASRLQTLMPFSRFADTIATVHASLGDPGIFVLYNGSYFMSDLANNRAFTQIVHPAIVENGFVTRYNKQGQLAVERVGDVRGHYRRPKKSFDMLDSDFTDVFHLKSAAAGTSRMVFLHDIEPKSLADMRRSVRREGARPGGETDLYPVSGSETSYHGRDGAQLRVREYGRRSFEDGWYHHPPLIERREAGAFVAVEGSLFDFDGAAAAPPVRTVV